MKNFFKKIIVVSLFITALLGVVACEEDFTNLGPSILKNTKFETKDTVLDVFISQRDIDAIRGDNIAIGSFGDFWLGVYQDQNKQYEKIEASLVSQLGTFSSQNLEAGVTDTTRVSLNFDNAFLKFPYKATKTGTSQVTIQINGNDSIISVPNFDLDSIIGSTTTGVPLKIYQNERYLSRLNQLDPSKQNVYKTDAIYDKGDLLNADANFKFIPNPNDTIYVYDRTLKDGSTFKDTLKLSNANPFLVIPLDKEKIRTLFYDKLNSSELTSQEALNDYFKGIIIEATGNENSLVPFSFVNGQQTFLNPSLELNYTTTVEHKTKNTVVDTLRNSVSVQFTGIQNRIYNMSQESVAAANNQIVIQGAAGKMGEVKLFTAANELANIRAKNWLINDATITFYVDESRDLSAIPERLFLYKESQGFSTQIKDTYQEGFSIFSGELDASSDKSYSFKITDYLSDVLGEKQQENSNLVLRVFNPTDNPLRTNVLDTIVANYNWNPKAVTIFNQLGSKKAKLKISYTELK